MGEVALNCPGCGTSMKPVVEGDVRYERCPSCEAIFLDRGELNTLATGMAGDIEFCSIDAGKFYPDVFPARACPKCLDTKMKKENLLSFSDLILDYCDSCGGWFLDRGELTAMNEKLAEIRRSQGGAAEYRGTHRGRLVTITEATAIAQMASFFGNTIAVPVAWRTVDVYFAKPLGLGLWITRESWGSRLLRLIGIHDVETGDAAFDDALLVKAEDAPGATTLLGDAARKAVLDFLASPHAAYGEERRFEIGDDRVRFAFTGGAAAGPDDPAVAALIEALVDVADGLDPTDTEA